MCLSWSLELCDYVGLNQWRVNDQMMPAPGPRDGYRAKQKASCDRLGHRGSPPPRDTMHGSRYECYIFIRNMQLSQSNRTQRRRSRTSDQIASVAFTFTTYDRTPRDQFWEMWSFPIPKARQRAYEEDLSPSAVLRPHETA